MKTLETIFVIFALILGSVGCSEQPEEELPAGGTDSGAQEEPEAEGPITSCDTVVDCAAIFSSAECNPPEEDAEGAEGNSWNYEELLAEDFADDDFLCLAGYASADEFASGCLTYEGTLLTAAAVEGDPCNIESDDNNDDNNNEEGENQETPECDWTANNGFGDSLENCWTWSSGGMGQYFDNDGPTLSDGILTFGAAPIASDPVYPGISRNIDLSTDITITLRVSSVEGGTFGAIGDEISFSFAQNGEWLASIDIETTSLLSYRCVFMSDIDPVPCATPPFYVRLKLQGSTVTAYAGTNLGNLTAFATTVNIDDSSNVSLSLSMGTYTNTGTFEVFFDSLEITQP